MAPPLLILALDGGEWSASQPLDRQGIGGWVGPRAGLNSMEKRKISCPCQESNPRRSVHRLV
jgi:hypothetical protein